MQAEPKPHTVHGLFVSTEEKYGVHAEVWGDESRFSLATIRLQKPPA